MTDPAPLIPPITRDEWTDDARDVFAVFQGAEAWENGTASHVVNTLAHYPQLAKPWLVFTRYLLQEAALSHRLREIAVQRVAWTRRDIYTWSSHLAMTLAIGMTRADLNAIKQGATSPHWSEPERTLLIAVDQLCDRCVMEEDIWAALSRHLDPQAMMDLMFTVGAYVTLAMVFNTIRVEREPAFLALAADYGAPDQPPP